MPSDGSNLYRLYAAYREDNPLQPHRPKFNPKVSWDGEHVVIICPHGTYQLLPHEAGGIEIEIARVRYEIWHDLNSRSDTPERG